MTSLQLKHITKTFEKNRVVSNLSLDVRSGEFFSLLGPSGCGKSTLLRIIAGLEIADSGVVSLDGSSIDATPAQKRGIGMVFQQYALWPHMTIAQNVRFGLETQPLTNKQRDERMHQALSRVQMGQFKDRYPHQISGGQQQRVALARALAMQPAIILLDEPLSNLDARLRAEIRQELAELHHSLGTTMIYVTHDQEDALSLSSRMAIMNRGTIEQVGSPEDVYRDPVSCFSAQFIGDANLIPCSVTACRENGQVEVRLNTVGDMLVTARTLGDASSNGEGHLCLRPSALTIVSSDNHKEVNLNTLRGEVLASRYKGAEYDLTVQISQELALSISCRATSMPRYFTPGSAIEVSWPTSEGVFIPN